MSQKSNTLTNQGSPNQIIDEYRVLHKVAQVLESSGSLMDILQKAMQIITKWMKTNDDPHQVQLRNL